MGCGCGCGKSADGEIEEKAGRVLSTRNLEKLRQAHELLSEVIAVGQPIGDVQTKDDEEKKDSEHGLMVKTIDPYLFDEIKPVVDYHSVPFRDLGSKVLLTVGVLTAEERSVLETAIRNVGLSTAQGERG
jgi:hypothetical protein